MPPAGKTSVVTCPKCGHTQREPVGAYSTICKSCRSHIRLDEPAPKAAAPKKSKSAVAPIEKPDVEKRKITCFQCGTELDVPVAAESTMCKRCSSHVDLRDYDITSTVSKNFRTYGRLVIQEKGYVLNTNSQVGEAIIKGRLIGKIEATRLLEIHSTAHIKGGFSTGRLVIPVGNRFHWTETLRIGGADIAGELVADIVSDGTVILRTTAKFFGNVKAANLVVESGAVIVGSASIGRAPAEDAKTPNAKPQISAKPQSSTSKRPSAAARAKLKENASDLPLAPDLDF